MAPPQKPTARKKRPRLRLAEQPAESPVRVETPATPRARAGSCLRCRRLVRGLHVLTLVTPRGREPYIVCLECLRELGMVEHEGPP